jgi:uncharacterized membrane-anchored protein
MIRDVWLILLDIAVLYVALYTMVLAVAEIERKGEGFITLVFSLASIGWVLYMGNKRRRRCPKW